MAETQGNTTELQALLDLAVQGRDEAYGELIIRASDRLLKLTRRMLREYPRVRRWEQSDDVFQNAAIRLYRSLAEVKPESVRGFFGLATTQIRRTLIDLARHHYGPEGHGAKHHTESDGKAADDCGGALHEHADGHLKPASLESWARFHEAVADLPANERDVFQFVWYGGMQQKEVAELLDVSVPTVQRRWYQAQHFLFQAMQQQPPSVEERQ